MSLIHVIVLLAVSGLLPVTAASYQSGSPLDTWNTTDANWDTGLWPNTLTTRAVFAGTGEELAVGTVNSGAITFDSANFVLLGGTIAIGQPTITTNQNATITSALTGSAGLTKTGAGKLTLTGASSFAGNSAVAAGTLEFSGTGGKSGNGYINVSGTPADNPILAINTSGTVTAGSGSPVGLHVATGLGTVGALDMHAGTLTMAPGKEIYIGHNSGVGTFNLTGGTVNANTWSCVGIGQTGTSVAGGKGILNISGTGHWNQSGGNMTIGNWGTTGSGFADGFVNVTGGTLDIAAAGALYLGQGGGPQDRSRLDISGTGVVKVGILRFNDANATGQQGTINISGGNLWANTINRNANGTLALNLSGGILGTRDNNGTWSVNMALTSGTTTFTAEDSASVARNITMSGVLSGAGALAKTGGGTLTLSALNTFTGDLAIENGNVVANSGSDVLNRATGPIGNPQTAGRKVTVGANATLAFTAHDALGNAQSTPLIHLEVIGGTITTDGHLVVVGPVTLNNGNVTATAGFTTSYGWQFNDVVSASGTSTMSATDGRNLYLSNVGTRVTPIYVASGSTLAIQGPMVNGWSNAASGLAKSGPGTLAITGTNIYSGATTVNGGILTGSGTLASAVTVNPGGTLASQGVFTINNTLAFNSGATAAMRIAKNNAAITADKIVGVSSLTYGGTLSVTDITSDANPLALGDRFFLFSAATRSGSFASYDLPTLPAGLHWDVTGLTADGSIAITDQLAPPVLSLAGGSYYGPQTLVLSVLTPGSIIHYTMDGTDPLASPTALSAPAPLTINLSGNTVTTVKAYVSANGQNSEVIAATYDTNTNLTTFGHMLEEMVDRDNIARHPDGAYTTHLVSSADLRDPGGSKTGQPAGHRNADFANFRGWEMHGTRKEWILINVEGPGVMTRWWSGGWPETGNCRIYLDNSDTPIFTGNSSLTQLVRDQFGALFTSTLAFVSGQGVNSYVPTPFNQRLKITWDGINPHGAGGADGSPPMTTGNCPPGSLWFNIEYRKYQPGVVLDTYNATDPVRNAIPLQNAVGKLNTPAVTGNVSSSATDTAALLPGQDLTKSLSGTGAIRRIRVNVTGPDQIAALTGTHIELTFDGVRTARVPVGPFFGNGKSKSTSAILNTCNGYQYSVAANNDLDCLWVMPYKSSAEVRLVNNGTQVVNAVLQVDSGSWIWDGRSMYYHADFRQEDAIKTWQNDIAGDLSEGEGMYNYVNLRGRGVIASDSLAIRNDTATTSDPWWGEGDEKIYVDDDVHPSIVGTGTEDYYGYAFGDSGKFYKRFVNQPLGEGNHAKGFSVNQRIRLLDTIPFAKRLKFDMEMWAWTTGTLDYQAVTHWYGTPGTVSLKRVADLGFDFKNGITNQTSQQVNIPDTAGTGTWNYFASSHRNPSIAGAVMTPLTWGAVGNNSKSAFGGGQAMTSLPAANLPAIGKVWIMANASANTGIQSAPAYHELDFHPGQGAPGDTAQPPYAVARWTAGPHTATSASIEGGLRNLVGTGDSIDFAIYHNGLEIHSLSAASTTLSDTAFDVARSIKPGDTLDFVVGNKDGSNALGDETSIRAMVYLPEAETNAISGTVQADTNNDATGDLPVSGVTLTLKDANGADVDNDLLSAGIQPTITTTAADGTYVFPGLASGNYQVMETDPSGHSSVSPNRLDVTLSAGSPATGINFIDKPIPRNFTSWAADTGITGGELGDSDQDGISNLIEYALLLNPSAPDGSPGDLQGNTLAFTKRPEAVANGDVSYRVQISPDLEHWESATDGVEESTLQIIYHFPADLTAGFSRLRIMQSIP